MPNRVALMRFMLVSGLGAFGVVGLVSPALAYCEPTGEPGQMASSEWGTLDWLDGLSDDKLVAVMNDDDNCNLPPITVTPPSGGGGGFIGGPPAGGGGGGGGGGEGGGSGGGNGSPEYPYTIPGVASCGTDADDRELQVTSLYNAAYQPLQSCGADHDRIGSHFQVLISVGTGSQVGIYVRTDSACASQHKFFEVARPPGCSN